MFYWTFQSQKAWNAGKVWGRFQPYCNHLVGQNYLLSFNWHSRFNNCKSSLVHGGLVPVHAILVPMCVDGGMGGVNQLKKMQLTLAMINGWWCSASSLSNLQIDKHFTFQHFNKMNPRMYILCIFLIVNQYMDWPEVQYLDCWWWVSLQRICWGTRTLPP